jgi:hypothetical protein
MVSMCGIDMYNLFISIHDKCEYMCKLRLNLELPKTSLFETIECSNNLPNLGFQHGQTVYKRRCQKYTYMVDYVQHRQLTFINYACKYINVHFMDN